ncbi:hypothetical protein RvY_10887 [Ramazzottius varieornatus]|uniref:Uncharacterized protein n=1 Tax=Ramazzottius varieornatus TaxID=947166 RepID=A0A1D1VJP0_RAMVA|nr:hypothetical protein RvY_10887 [Ramazzottius varieornatus]
MARSHFPPFSDTVCRGRPQVFENGSTAKLRNSVSAVQVLVLFVLGGYNQPEPIYIQITNVVSPQVTSNAVSNANSATGLPGSLGSGTKDLRGLLLLSGTQLVPYQGSAKDVKVVHIPVLVPVNATSPTGSSLTPSSTVTPLSPAYQPVQPSSSKVGNSLPAQSEMTTKKKAWTFPSK